jgi:hypothetical protein
MGMVNSLSGSVPTVYANVEAAHRSILLHYFDPKAVQ